MAGEWDVKSVAPDDPWAVKSVRPVKSKPKARRSAAENAAGLVTAFNRGTGIGDELSAGVGVVQGLLTGRHRFGTDKPGNVIANNLDMLGDAYQIELAARRQIEDDFTAAHPKASLTARGLGSLSTAAIPAGASVQGGNAMMQIARGATVGGASGYVGGLVDRGDLGERLDTARNGMLVGGVLGGTIAAIPPAAQAIRNVGERLTRRREPINAMLDYAPQDAAAVAARRQEMIDAGFENPALVDVVDETGRGVIRGTASRNTPARQAARDFAEARSLNLPDRMGRQARRVMSNDPRTPAQIAGELGAQRAEAANAAFGAVRGERVGLTDDAVMALRSPDGRAAIRSAAQSAMRSIRPEDRAIAAELNRLADEVLDQPGQVQVTVGMSQNISEALFDAADVAARRGANREAAQLGDLARAIRNNARTAVPGYDDALRGFEAQSRLIDAAERGEDFLQRSTDEFVTDVSAMTPEELALSRATGRRAVERAAGENISAAPGVARRIALAPEQQARNAALLGPEDAARLEGGMATEARAVQNAADINPRTGSQTQLRSQDAARLSERVQDVAAVGAAVTGHPLAAIQRVLQRVGINDRQAQAITEIAIDPNRLEEAIQIIQARGLSRQQAAEVVQQLRLSAGVGYLGGTQSGQGRGVTAGVDGPDGMVYWQDGTVTPQ